MYQQYQYSPQFPYSEHAVHQQYNQPMNAQLKSYTLQQVEPFVQYGLKEAQATSYQHTLREVAAIAYLMGKGYDTQTAYKTVESWELNEYFYRR